ncbi:MAG: hypothetical protein ACXAEU_00630 [Candidatus Hodarchaeales archaeon]|jgi:hypothetical protein
MPIEGIKVERGGKEVLKEIQVDLWKTKMHSKTIGIKQKEVYMAKSRYFTKDSKVVGEIKEEGETIGYLIHRDIDDRLIIRLFSKSMYYQASLEEMLAREQAKKLIHDQNFPEFNIIMKDYPFVIQISKERGGFGNPEIYTFLHYGEEHKSVEPFIIKSKRGLGEDFDVKSFDKKVAEIDGAKLDVGGSFKIRIFDPELAKTASFYRSLIIFAGSLKYLNEVKDRIKKFADFQKKGEIIKLSDGEILAQTNPRKWMKKT